MERLLEYIHENEDRVGRFGTLKKGDVIKCDEREYREGLKSDKFKAVRSRSVSAEAEDEFIPQPSPIASDFFDLRSIKWNRGDTLRRLKRTHKRVLTKIAMAIEDISKISVAYGTHVSREEIATSVYDASITLGWTQKS
jgi:hypothetical protein